MYHLCVRLLMWYYISNMNRQMPDIDAMNTSDTHRRPSHTSYGQKLAGDNSTIYNPMPGLNDMSVSNSHEPGASERFRQSLLDPTNSPDMTKRISEVLSAVKVQGFTDFDSVAVAYYTTQFERGSMPAMAQRASRSRRLETLIQQLQESSKGWPKRETQRFHESLSRLTGKFSAHNSRVHL
jgi:hypothetical protein